ncbi:MAG: hypothetical protein RLZZ136_1515 [Pseudomonadota bacterium]
MLESLAPWAGLIGLIGLSGFSGLKQPIAKDRQGGAIRLMALIGFVGLSGFWVPGAGAIGAAGALGLWNHQNPKLAFWGRLGWLFLIGVPFFGLHFLR